MREKIFNKGYTVEVVSWENDGDYYATNRKTYYTKEEAFAVKHMAETLWVSNSKSEQGIGNLTYHESEKYYSRVYKYFTDNPTLLILEGGNVDECPDDIHDRTSHFHELLGYSSDYHCRVCDSVKVYYSEEDIYVEVCHES